MSIVPWRLIPKPEIVQIVGRILEAFHDITLKDHLANAPDVVPCPTPNCPAWFALPDSNRNRICCPSCKFVSCSRCSGPFHRKLSCKMALAKTVAWQIWTSSGRSDFWGKADLGALPCKFEQTSKPGPGRLIQLILDEEWKEQHLRLCPHYARPVEHTGGCMQMMCGRDAHGGNVQAECNRPFYWNAARPYVSSNPAQHARLLRRRLSTA
jgi:hypothetical protein